jgi:hypothetical protein
VLAFLLWVYFCHPTMTSDDDKSFFPTLGGTIVIRIFVIGHLSPPVRSGLTSLSLEALQGGVSLNLPLS